MCLIHILINFLNQTQTFYCTVLDFCRAEVSGHLLPVSILHHLIGLFCTTCPADGTGVYTYAICNSTGAQVQTQTKTDAVCTGKTDYK